MGRRKRQSRLAEPAAVLPAARTWRLLPLLAGVAIGAAAVAMLTFHQPVVSMRAAPVPTSTTARRVSVPASLAELIALPPAGLARIDVARVNLLCAVGLPGADELSSQRMDELIAELDRFAAIVRYETERHLYRVTDPKFKEHWGGSEARFRADMLKQVLQDDCGLHYSEERKFDVDFTRSKDLFIHGLIKSDNGGTCVSMPVVYAAVGRRLGYPIRLVATAEHTFCRWDGLDHADPRWRDRFNIEITNYGSAIVEDAHYMTWPQRLTPEQVKRNRLLVSLSPREELASFLASRGHCLSDLGRHAEAQLAYSQAHLLAPEVPIYLHWLASAVERELPGRTASRGSGKKKDSELDREALIRRAEAINAENQRRMEQHLRSLGVPVIPGQSPTAPALPGVPVGVPPRQ